MFRLKDSQLHMIMWLMVAVVLLLVGIFGLERGVHIEHSSSWKGMDNFSDGWICTYDTADLEKLETYRRQNPTDEEAEKEQQEESYSIVDVVTFPATLSVQKDTTVVAVHNVPDVNLETVYVVLETDGALVRAFVDEKAVYVSSEKEQMLPVRHVIPILPEDRDKTMTIEISGMEKELKLNSIQSGTYNQLWVTTLQEHGISFGLGILLIGISLCMLMVWGIVKNVWHQKRLLFYAGMEGLVLGTLCLLNAEVIPLVTGLHYGVFIMKALGIMIAIVLHLTIIRCFIYKKKVLSVIDGSILLLGVLYISAVVLQVFSLLYFDTIYRIGFLLYGVMVVLFTIVLAITIFDYGRKEGLPVFVANVILIVCILAQLLMLFAGRQTGGNYLYIQIGFLLYMLYIWIYGLKQAFHIPSGKEEQISEAQIREQVVEQINPNLLFASFYTLQGLIKSGSSNSVKMIYYISVYFRDNLKAMESEGEVISFKDELEHIIAYLQLQKTRNPKLDFAIECKVKEFNIPRHTLEPLVENAVKHGIAKHDNTGNVAIRTYTRADGYAIQIIDDGAGFDTSVLKRKSSTMMKKLSLLEQSCQAKTEVISKAGKGTVITIVLPMLENELLDELE